MSFLDRFRKSEPQQAVEPAWYRKYWGSHKRVGHFDGTIAHPLIQEFANADQTTLRQLALLTLNDDSLSQEVRDEVSEITINIDPVNGEDSDKALVLETDKIAVISYVRYQSAQTGFVMNALLFVKHPEQGLIDVTEKAGPWHDELVALIARTTTAYRTVKAKQEQAAKESSELDTLLAMDVFK